MKPKVYEKPFRDATSRGAPASETATPAPKKPVKADKPEKRDKPKEDS